MYVVVFLFPLFSHFSPFLILFGLFIHRADKPKIVCLAAHHSTTLGRTTNNQRASDWVDYFNHQKPSIFPPPPLLLLLFLLLFLLLLHHFVCVLFCFNPAGLFDLMSFCPLAWWVLCYLFGSHRQSMASKISLGESVTARLTDLARRFIATSGSAMAHRAALLRRQSPSIFRTIPRAGNIHHSESIEFIVYETSPTWTCHQSHPTETKTSRGSRHYSIGHFILFSRRLKWSFDPPFSNRPWLTASETESRKYRPTPEMGSLVISTCPPLRSDCGVYAIRFLPVSSV